MIGGPERGMWPLLDLLPAVMSLIPEGQVLAGLWGAGPSVSQGPWVAISGSRGLRGSLGVQW